MERLGRISKFYVLNNSNNNISKPMSKPFMRVENYENVLKIFKNAKSALGEILSAFEVMDALSISSTVKNMKLSNPISEYPFYILLETQGSDGDHDSDKLNRFLSKEMEKKLILDGLATSDPGKVESIWKLRESIPAAGLMDGYMFAYDVSLPLPHYYEIVPKLRQKLGAKATVVCGFGHVGDGNIHINVTLPEYNPEVLSLLEPYVFEEVSKLKGSVSAEHGMGFRKPHYLHYSKDNSAIMLMRSLKQLMDPNGILNPYKVLPDIAN